MSSAPAQNQAAQRLFFALWPNARLQATLHLTGQHLQKAFGGRVVRTENIHLTLAFLGSVPPERIDELLAIGGLIKVNRFELELSETGCWKRSAVGWIAPETLPEPLTDLVLELRRRLLEAGFRVDHKAFSPHVTLVRKARCKPNATQPVASLVWPVARFALMVSRTLERGPVYTQISDWSLD